MVVRSFVSVIVASSLSIACSAGGGVAETSSSPAEFAADIRYTEYGIPHVKADDFKGAGYGAGYAFVEGNLCLFADTVVTLNGERSKYFGADETYMPPFVLFNNNGPVNNLKSDAYFKYNYTDEKIAYVKQGASQDVHDLLAGFAAGYNRHLGEMRQAAIENNEVAPACVNEPWVRDLTVDDVFRRAQNINILETSDLFRTAIPSAVPPKATKTSAVEKGKLRKFAMEMHDLHVGGSNVMAFGKDATENGKGLVFSNPHFPWYSSERQYAMHLTVGDEYDAIGSTLLGLPVPLAGWNQSMAWSITYHTDQRFAIYELDLDASDPTKYIVDGETKSMVAVPVTIDVLQSDGKIMPVEHVFYETEFGVVLSAGPFLWSQEHAYAVMDFSIGNNRMMDQYLAIGRAKNVREVKAAQDKYLGLQFSNLGAADANGEAYYSNMAVSADYADEKLDRCFAGEAAKGFFASFGSLLLKGTKACLPDNDPSAPQANIIPANRRPYIFRDDYVLNTNASHWIVNADPKSYLGGFNKTIGNENTARGERTRAAIKMVEDRLNGTDGLPGNKMTTDHLLELFYRGQNRTAELVVDDLVESCSKDPIVKAEGVTVDLAEACEILSKWDRRNHVDSVGAIIFEVFTQLLPSKFAVDYLPQDQFWKTPYDPADPLGTPRGFKVTSVVREALARAVYMLATYGVALDAPYGSVHGSSDKNGKHYGLPGGARLFHNIRITPEKGKGLTGPVTNGNSYMHMVSFDEEGPQAKFVLAYSQATDKKSANYMDQLPVYGSGQWMDMPFTEKQLEKQGYKLVRISQ